MRSETGMNTTHIDEKYPDFLHEYGKLLSHFQNEFSSLSSKEKGDYFAEFVARLVPHTEIGRQFDHPKKGKATHDEGVDLTAKSIKDNGMLYVQSKYTIPGVDELDSIFSKFQNFSRLGSPQQYDFFDAGKKTLPQFMIVTMADLTTIIQKYRKSQRGGKEFYNRLMVDERINIVHGPDILHLLREIFRKTNLLPAELTLSFASPLIRMENVHIGVLSCNELNKLYDIFGDSLFFENIREYLGPTSSKVKTSGKRISVNEAIAQTLDEEPSQFLARNNGITFRAGKVEPLDNHTLKLYDASIVNGRQTTMTIVENPTSSCFLLVKVVQASDTWDIAKAANFQNSVDQLDLELAKFVRPQAIRAAATLSSTQFRGTDPNSAYSVVDAIYRKEVTYEEFVDLFLGLFSTSPTNILNRNYTEVRADVIKSLFQEGNIDRDFVFDVIFKLHQANLDAAKHAEESLREEDNLSYLFQRFWKQNKTDYRAYIAILASCGCLNKDIFSGKEKPTYEEIMSFLHDLDAVLDDDPSKLHKYYQLAFTVIALDAIEDDKDDDEFLRYLHQKLNRAKFSNLVKKLKLLAISDNRSNSSI